MIAAGTFNMILRGARHTGSFTDGYHYIWEDLFIDEADEVKAFCEYLENEIGGAGSGNIHQLYECFKHQGSPPFDEIAETIKGEIMDMKLRLR